jgi:O-antigen/teichoic acid export membrane protein
MASHTLQETTTTSSSIDLVKRRLLSGGAWALGGRVVLAFTGLATNALLARLMSPAELGVYFLAYSVVITCANLGALGLETAVVRFVAESIGLEQYKRTRRSIKLALGIGSLGAVVVGSAYLLFGGRLASLLFDSPALAAVAGMTAGWIVVAALQGILVETFRGFHDIRMTTILGGVTNGNGILTGGLLSLALLVLFLFRGDASLTMVMLLAVASGATSALLAGWLLRRRVASLPQDKHGIQFSGGQMMHVAWPLLVTTLAAFALGQSSIWIAGAFLGQKEVALYGAAYRLVAYVTVPLQIANMVAPPVIAEMYAQGRIQGLEHTLRAIATTAGIPAFLLLAAFVLFGGPIVGLLFGDYYREAAVLLALLSLGKMVSVWAGSCGKALLMTGHHTTMMAVTIATGLITVAGAIWAAQHYGVTGIAGAAATGIVLQNMIMLLAVRKKVGVWTHAGLSGLLSKARLGQ